MKRVIWFKRKTYGWGWTPATWQGWAILGIYTGGLITLLRSVSEETLSSSNALTDFYLPLFGMTVVLLVVTVLTGEKPGWQWGKNKSDE